MGRQIYFRDNEIEMLLMAISNFEKSMTDTKSINRLKNYHLCGLLSASNKLDGVDRNYSSNCIWKKED